MMNGAIEDGHSLQRIRMLFMAKHALFGGGMHPEDGNHAIYHHEVRTTLEGLGLNLQLANQYDVLYSKPNVDFVFPLLNQRPDRGRSCGGIASSICSIVRGTRGA